MTWAVVLLLFVTLQRGAELVQARANERRLRARGAVEVGAAHYPVMVALHAAWLASLWIVARDGPVQPAWTALYLVLQLGRAWVLLTLGRRWSTRVFVVPGETLVARGPYRFVSHPNYVVVACEIFVLPLALSRPGLALLFGLANLVMLWWRIRVEGRALAQLATRPA